MTNVPSPLRKPKVVTCPNQCFLILFFLGRNFFRNQFGNQQLGMRRRFWNPQLESAASDAETSSKEPPKEEEEPEVEEEEEEEEKDQMTAQENVKNMLRVIPK